METGESLPGSLPELPGRESIDPKVDTTRTESFGSLIIGRYRWVGARLEQRCRARRHPDAASAGDIVVRSC